MKLLCVLCILCGSVFPALALDREAFTFTKYDLDVRVEPEQQRLGVRGKITLRNDSATSQSSLAVQISSTLAWRSIKIAGKPVDFDSHEYASDIDHTGALSEAIVTLPKEIAPGQTLDIEVGYEGTIPLDATRLTRIGVPEDKAKHSDWDQISKTFTAVRGIGYVTWYPVATEAAVLSDGDSVPEEVGRWKKRSSDAEMKLVFESTSALSVLFSGAATALDFKTARGIASVAGFSMARLGVDVPTFVIADYQKLTPTDAPRVYYLAGQNEAAQAYTDAVTTIDLEMPVVGGDERLQIVGMPDPNSASFVTADMLICPLKTSLTNETMLSLVYAKARGTVPSPRAWIQDGLAHYAQAAFIETEAGRQAALNYLSTHVAALVEGEKTAAKEAAVNQQAPRSLINAPDGLYLQTKAMYVWWMLREMLGRLPTESLLTYRADEDKDATYLERLIEKNSHRDLQWFFDDWVYHDRGLPDFRVASVYPSPLATGGYLVTVEIENLGNAGAEVPITLKLGDTGITRRIEVRAKSKASIRIDAPTFPTEVAINDGSVPESDVSNNTYKIQPIGAQAGSPVKP